LALDNDSSLRLSEQEFIGNIFIFLVAGHETSGGSMTHALALLALYPDVQEKLYQHIISVIGLNTPTYDDFPKLTYTYNVMKETLRLYPSVVVVPKINPKPVTLKVPTYRYQTNQNKKDENKTEEKYTTLKIPPNTRINLDVCSLHRNPRYWVRPNEFIPERFDPASKIQDEVYQENSSNDEDKENDGSGMDRQQQRQSHHRHAWIPFSDGIRSCLGRKFAEVEFVCTITMIVQNYVVRLPKDIKIDNLLDCHTVITLKPKRPFQLIFKKRERV